MSKATFLFKLMAYVNAKKVFTAQEVADEFDISIRTAHRYLAELSEMGVPLYTEQGRNGGYRILNNRMLPPVMFNENEAFSIFFAFQALQFYRSLPFDIEIQSVSDKLYSGLPSDTRRKIDRLNGVLSFWQITRSVPSRYLMEIIEAAIERQIVRFEYESKDKCGIREVSPIGLYASNGFWYMPARDLADDEVKLFRTDRIVTLDVTGKNQDPAITLIEWLSNHAVREPEDAVRLYVELNREGLRQCRGQPWLEPHIAVCDEDHAYIDTTIDKCEVEYVSMYFLQLGTAAKVIEPREVIDHINKRSWEILRHYADI